MCVKDPMGYFLFSNKTWGWRTEFPVRNCLDIPVVQTKSDAPTCSVLTLLSKEGHSRLCLLPACWESLSTRKTRDPCKFALFYNLRWPGEGPLQEVFRSAVQNLCFPARPSLSTGVSDFIPQLPHHLLSTSQVSGQYLVAICHV